MCTIMIQRSIPLRLDVDVCVVGGGTAGVAAAVAAARQGARVYLAEETSCLGGLGTAGLVPAFMMFGDGVRFVADGLGREILYKLSNAGGCCPSPPPENGYWGTGIHAETFKRVLDDFLVDTGVDFTFHTKMIDVVREDELLTTAIFAAKSGQFAVRAKIFIDASGDGDLCAWAGVPYEKGDEDGRMMPGTLCTLWSDIDFARYDRESPHPDGARLQEAIDASLFTYPDLHLPGMWRVSRSLMGGNIGHTFDVDGTDERSLTRGLLWGRKVVLEYEQYYKQYLRGFEEMELAATASLLGVRETRRITGDYQLCIADFKRRAVFEDEIGRYSYPVDIHPMAPDPEEMARHVQEFTRDYHYQPGESYGIPYRCMLPVGLANTFVVGRCVSSDRYLQASIRVMPGCFLLGQAAGVAAALAAPTRDTRGISIATLHIRLKELGAYLPNS